MIKVINNSGIGNRLKNIVSAIRLAELTNDSVILDRDYSVFFTIEDEFREALPEEKVYTTWILDHFVEVGDNPLINPNIFYVFHNEDVIFDFNSKLDFQYHNIKKKYTNLVLSYFKKIKFSSNVENAVEDICRKINPLELVGLHIRSWIDEPSRHKLLFNMEKIRSKIDEFDLKQRFFVATDSNSVIENLRKNYGERIIFLNSNIDERHISIHPSAQVFYNALIDLLVLSRCPRFIGSYQSTYSEVAWWLSGCTSRVDIVMPEEQLRKLEK